MRLSKIWRGILGYKHSPETRAKIAAANVGNRREAETNERNRNATTNRSQAIDRRIGRSADPVRELARR